MQTLGAEALMCRQQREYMFKKLTGFIEKHPVVSVRNELAASRLDTSTTDNSGWVCEPNNAMDP